MFSFVPAAFLGKVEAFLLSMPESAGLLAFGLGLVVLAVTVRRVLKRTDDLKSKEEVADRL